MSLLDAFVIVSRPITEIFHVNSEAITLKSQFHPGVEIAIQPDTFDQETQVILEVIIKGKCSNSIGLKNGCFVDFSAIVYHHCLHFLLMRRHGFIANGIICFCHYQSVINYSYCYCIYFKHRGANVVSKSQCSISV